MEAHSLGINTTDKYHAFPRGSCSLSILPTLTISIINHYNNTMNQHLVFGPPPSQTSFPDISTALRHCQDHARDLGYSVVLRSTVKDLLGSPFRSYFACDRGGVYRDRTKPSAKPRKKRSEDGVLDGTASRKTNCPFQLRLDIDENKTWKLIVNQLAHNHLPSLNASAWGFSWHSCLRCKAITQYDCWPKLRWHNWGLLSWASRIPRTTFVLPSTSTTPHAAWQLDLRLNKTRRII